MKTSRTRSLGLAVVALLALAAIEASAAQAGQFTAGSYPSTIKGQVGIHLIETEVGTMICSERLDGELASAAETLTLTPDFGSTCTLNGKEVHFNANGCDYLLHAGATRGWTKSKALWTCSARRNRGWTSKSHRCRPAIC